MFLIAEELVEIQEVAIIDKSTDWEDNSYTVSGSIMDGVSNPFVVNVDSRITLYMCVWNG